MKRDSYYLCFNLEKAKKTLMIDSKILIICFKNIMRRFLTLRDVLRTLSESKLGDTLRDLKVAISAH